MQRPNGCQRSTRPKRRVVSTKLVERAVRPDAGAAPDDGPLEEAPVACQQDPALRSGDRGEALVIRVAAIPGVEAEHPQVRGEPAQVAIHDEPRLERVFGLSGQRRHHPEHGGLVGRPCLHPVAVADMEVKSCRRAIHRDRRDLRMGAPTDSRRSLADGRPSSHRSISTPGSHEARSRSGHRGG